MKKFATRLFLLLIVFSAVTFAQDADNEAKKQYNEGIKIYKEGNKLRKSGDYAGAVAKYDDALKLTGNFSTDDYAIYYYKGVTLKKTKKI
jgi:outer membrane protein assembly factor BamD (BamD/ComL family)